MGAVTMSRALPDARTPGAQEMSAAAVHRLVDTIAGMLLQLPAPQRLEVLRQVEARVRPIANEGEVIRKVSRAGRGFFITLPAEMRSYVGLYKARLEGSSLTLEPGGDDVKIRFYSGRLRLLLPKRLVEALGFPGYVRVRVEGSRIIVEPA